MFWHALLYIRFWLKKEDKDRVNERRGISDIPRPNGSILWFHGASYGEAKSGLILIKHLEQHLDSDTHILFTTGTISSARLFETIDNPRIIHQYLPIDHPKWVARFLDHWRPDATLWLESELWPNILHGMRMRNIPALLINARMSEKSFRRWKFCKPWVSKILSTFACILTQTKQAHVHYSALTDGPIAYTNNIKYGDIDNSYDTDAYQDLYTSLKGRPVWLAASTHDGEEIIAANIHTKLKVDHKNLQTIIVPRHPERTDAILKTLPKDLKIEQRSHTPTPSHDCDIYIVDSFGEMNLFYALAPFAFIGKSLSQDGGHNPIEASTGHTVIASGPHVKNFAEVYAEYKQQDACLIVANADNLYTHLNQFFNSPDIYKNYALAAQKLATEKKQVIDAVLSHVLPFLNDTLPPRS